MHSLSKCFSGCVHTVKGKEGQCWFGCQRYIYETSSFVFRRIKMLVLSLTHVNQRCAINVQFSEFSFGSPAIASVSKGFFVCCMIVSDLDQDMFKATSWMASEFRGITASFTYSIVAKSFSELVIQQVIYFRRMA